VNEEGVGPEFAVTSLTSDERQLEFLPASLGELRSEANDRGSPRRLTEERLAAIWSELLGVPHIDRHDNFFALGGNSLSAVLVLERIRQEGFEADDFILFSTPNFSEFVAAIGNSRPIEIPSNLLTEGCEPITPAMLPLIDLTQEDIDRIVAATPGGLANIQDIYALSPLQDGILFHHLLVADGDPYLLSGLLAFADRALLDRHLAAYQQVVDRHDILRTAFHWHGLSTPAQVVRRHATLSVTELTLDPANGSVAEQLLQRFDPRHHRLDLAEAPLLRFVVAFDAAQQRWLVLQLLHHLIGDASSLKTLHDEVHAIVESRGEALPAPRPFRNLVAQARLGVSAEEHERFFRAMLADIDEPTAPFGFVDVHRDGAKVAEARRMLPQPLNDRLRAQARRLGVSLASLCHLAWGQVLARTSGRETVVFGTVLFGRMQAGEGADAAMGLFINTLPVRLDLDATGTEEAVRHTHARLAELLRHERRSRRGNTWWVARDIPGAVADASPSVMVIASGNLVGSRNFSMTARAFGSVA
jgi:Condensation domain/Phosphopantetheine attachment site